ncbi:hypothetical protein KR093_005952 [Drosophila rubida]|uniref:Nucleoporin NUP53 n=1 Tax=Drosophila rubida TaxID=30044 RepID=A0AAD4PQX4_9MUSC|nr:hypothetical protein KR093_005952 [Drosophila rubida]
MEPMALGSPIGSPGSSNQSQYLPPFLMGDPQAMTPHNNTLSPKMSGRYNVSFDMGYHHNPHSHQLNRSTLGTRTLFSGSVGNANISSGGGGVSNTGSGHQAGPPTQGLFDSLRNEHVSGGTPQRHQLSMLQSSHLNGSAFSLNQSCHPPTAQLNDSYAPNGINASMRALCSPLGSVSPMTSRSPKTRVMDFWVTIFGFSPGASSMILQHFTTCGTIVDVVHAPLSGNWMHVRFASRIESDKALNYNLRIIAHNVMVGVTRCTDESVLDKENNVKSPDTESLRPKVRPLAQQSYNHAQQENEVSPKSNVPQKSTGLVNKAMDMLFGW